MRFDSLPATDRITFVDHYVGRGQTLSDIARRYGVSVTLLQSANPTLQPHALRVGQRIIVPMSGRVVPLSAWSVPPERTYRRVSRGGAAGGGARLAPPSGGGGGGGPLAVPPGQHWARASTLAPPYRGGVLGTPTYHAAPVGDAARARRTLTRPPEDF